jgi:hypothetical protein
LLIRLFIVLFKCYVFPRGSFATTVHNPKVKRWLLPTILVALASASLLFARATTSNLLEDTDTAVLLAKIRQADNPWKWFIGDWPLENHFYRPISTLAFEFDNRLYANNAAGYGLTNALLAVFCTLALFWLLRELTEDRVIATAATLLFVAWQSGRNLIPEWLPWAGAILLLFVGIDRHRSNWKIWAPPPLLLVFVATEAVASPDLRGVVIQWLPGRTASVMALFVLVSMAAYCRFERLGATRTQREIGPLDPPATKGTAVEKAGLSWPWMIVSAISLALALGSYEQAVMAPALLLASAVTLRLRGYRVRWSWHILFWLELAGYLAVRATLVPREVSGYQAQALRSGPGVWIDLAQYALPAATTVLPILAMLSMGAFFLIDPRFYASLLQILSNAAAIAKAPLRLPLVAAGYGMSVLAFLPMAWLMRFAHYHYLPLAFRALFVVAMAWVFFESAAIALSPRARQAPERLAPAPGSLPRR